MKYKGATSVFYTKERITSFTQLKAWQNAREFAVYIYALTRSFPPEERFGLSSQIQRSAVSVSANLAEGFSRNSAKDKAQFYTVALGSLTETLSHLYIAIDLGYIAKDEALIFEDKFTALHKLINGLIKSAQSRGY